MSMRQRRRVPLWRAAAAALVLQAVVTVWFVGFFSDHRRGVADRRAAVAGVRSLGLSGTLRQAEVDRVERLFFLPTAIPMGPDSAISGSLQTAETAVRREIGRGLDRMLRSSDPDRLYRTLRVLEMMDSTGSIPRSARGLVRQVVSEDLGLIGISNLPLDQMPSSWAIADWRAGELPPGFAQLRLDATSRYADLSSRRMDYPSGVPPSASARSAYAPLVWEEVADAPSRALIDSLLYSRVRVPVVFTADHAEVVLQRASNSARDVEAQELRLLREWYLADYEAAWLSFLDDVRYPADSISDLEAVLRRTASAEGLLAVVAMVARDVAPLDPVGEDLVRDTVLVEYRAWSDTIAGSLNDFVQDSASARPELSRRLGAWMGVLERMRQEWRRDAVLSRMATLLSQPFDDVRRLTGTEPALSIIVDLPVPALFQRYDQELVAVGGNGRLTWSYDGTLPLGLTLDSGSGQIFGRPVEGRSYNFTLAVSDSTGARAERSYTGRVAVPFVITTAELPSTGLGDAYDQLVEVTGWDGDLRWSHVSGSLPPGLTIDSDSGRITGVSSSPGSFEFNVAVEAVRDDGENEGRRATQKWTVSVLPEVSPTDAAGVDSGSPVESLECGSGAVAVGLVGRAGADIDAVGVLCRLIVGGTLSEPVLSEEVTTTAVRGGGGQDFRRVCQAGSVMRGVVGTEAGIVDQLEVLCANPVRAPVPLGRGVGERTDGSTTFNLACPALSFAAGIEVRMGDVLEQVRVRCR